MMMIVMKMMMVMKINCNDGSQWRNEQKKKWGGVGRLRRIFVQYSDMKSMR